MPKITYPKNEILWTTYRNSENEVMFYLTSNQSRDTYYMYEMQDTSGKKLGRGKTPPELEERFGIWEIIRNRG